MELEREVTFGFEVDEVLTEFLGRDLPGGFVEVLAQLPDAGQVGLLGAGSSGSKRRSSVKRIRLA